MREIILDTETTGFDPFKGDKIIEIGCIEVVNKIKTGNFFHSYVNPDRDVPLEAFNVHGISTEFLFDKPRFADIHSQFQEFIGDSPLVIHNAGFDMKFLNFEFSAHSIKVGNPVVDTLMIARSKFPGSPASLDALCKRFKIDSSHRTKHGALLDAELLAEVYFHLMGGNQTKLAISNTTSLVNNRKSADKNYREPRIFELSEQEKLDHQQFMKKIKNPLWAE